MIQKAKAKFEESVIFKTYLAMLVVYGAACMIEPNYFSLSYVLSLLTLATFLGILCAGQMMVMLTGGIDLSIASVLTLTGVLTTGLNSKIGNPALSFLLILFIALLAGLLNGIGIVYLKIPPIVMTLAMSNILSSAVFLYTKGTPRGYAPEWLIALATGSAGEIRYILLCWVVLSTVVIILLEKSVLGRKIYAVGNNMAVSHLSGINHDMVIISVYVMSALFGALSGMLLTGYSTMSFLTMGDSYLMLTITAVVIGGTSASGGAGRYHGVIAGVIITYIIQAILTALSIPEAGRDIVYGVMILLVVLLYGRGKKTAES